MVFKIRGCIEEAKKDNGHRPIHLVIMSPGGSVFAGLIALNELEQSGLYVEMEAVNICASMCATMLQYPVIQKRLVRSNTLIMIHGAAGTQEGNELAQREGQKALRAIDRSLMRIISERSGIPFEKLMKMCERGEWMWFVGPEAVKAGLADKVVKPKLAPKPVAVKK
jgi:ATP-dependent Clp protease protease subunit